MKWMTITIGLLTAFASNSVAQTARLNPTTDYALINGAIHTMDEAGTVAEAIGITGNEIVYVGDAAGLANVIGIGTEVIDLEGNMVLPGFVEGHMHPTAGALIMRGVDLQIDSIDGILERVRTYAEENPELPIIHGYGVRLHLWDDGYGTKEMLDEIDADRPIFLWGVDGHQAWVNSKAFEIAGIDENTPETVPGFSFFRRNEDGTPAGWIVEVPAQMQVLSKLIDLNIDYTKTGVREWLPRFAAAGITTAHDYGIQGLGQDEGFQLMTDLAASGELPIRVQGNFYWNDPNLDPIPPLEAMREQFDTDLVSARGLKINMDGGDDAYSALYTEPYSDNPDASPNPIIPFDTLNETVLRADAAGINVVCHCFGDAAVRAVLDAIELAISQNPPRDRRNVISHAMLVHPDDIPRFAELDVTWDSTGAWMSLDPALQSVTVQRLGDERVKQYSPMRAIAKAGGNVSLGSDWPAAGYISEYRPLVAIRTAVMRQLPGRDDVPPLGGEEARVPIDLAIRANTINAAYGMGKDHEIGSIEVGKLADLVVLSENLYEIDPSTIHDVEVLYTIMDGNLTWDHTKQ
ncbi:amidohydrolase [Ruegeria atlantica]|uniref:amidohydrolase n=1 Tax=Ruegeria atlantica TaxID=81569 RepID=UPI00148025B3|nr:amidohydrolase [Ruegeria atlantica]